jgi:hypothetical protein
MHKSKIEELNNSTPPIANTKHRKYLQKRTKG